jgi:hypothetical protein
MGRLVLGADDLNRLMTRLGDDGSLQDGSAHVLAFDAIRDRSRRWLVRQEAVRDFIERTFLRSFPASATLLPLDDVNFLVIQPSESGYGAQGRALRLMAEVLRFFLGVSARADLKLSRVTRIGPDGVETAPVEIGDADETSLEAMEPEARALSGSTQTIAASPIDGQGLLTGVISHGRKGPAPLVRGDRTYDAMSVIEPIWSVRQEAVVSYLLRPLVFEKSDDGLAPADLASASLRDLLSLDLIVLSEAERVLKEQEPGGRIALHVPIHQAVLAMSNARQTLLSALNRVHALASSVIVVLAGLEMGTPHSRLLEATSLLANRCRAVVALAPGFDCPIDRWRDAHLSGVGVDFSNRLGGEAPPTLKQITAFAARFDGVAPALIAYSAPTTAMTLAAWSAGFTHVGGDVVFKTQKEILRPARVKAVDIYRHA